ncbi:hypothetical protein [Winogradskyella forsetii]|uniref:hypothetical protein n=1 Tax=Winogradskyella forsetii TaxID=2686077 RepID=UPI0015B98801|nr:hypothetical protein [Winogradskyella forsetii]
MKNLLNLGKALNKAEQKQIFGGNNKLIQYSDPCPSNMDPNCGGGGGGTGIPNSGTCQTDADCGMATVQVPVECPPNWQWDSCGYTSEQVQMTCFNNGGSSGTCVV